MTDSASVSPALWLDRSGRRVKAAFALTAIWGSTIALHLVSWGAWFVVCVTAVMSVHALRVLLARPAVLPPPLGAEPSDPDLWPYVSLLVAAKNEESVIGRVVSQLMQLDYPSYRYDVWVINDNSDDRTPAILDRLARQYEHLHVIHRDETATGGKSGALNLVWPQTQADILAVFDADARIPSDLLRRVLPVFDQPEVGAIQVRKAIANADENFWTRGQVAEMAMDTYFQQQRISLGGIGELRGNGQFVRRTAIESCGGWNEETITDDLDLTIQLHIHQWNIECVAFPAVEEEGVTRAIGLWHQRNRWAEGGYQRYLDYWPAIARNRLGWNKTLDLVAFMTTQYLLPTASIPDLAMSVLRSTPPILAPMTGLMLSLSVVGMTTGLWRTQKQSIFVTAGQTLRGMLYMLHWIPVMASTMMRVAVRPKRLKWVKTIHQGDETWLDGDIEHQT